MSSKFLNVFADDTRDLQRQIGCMTGIFQMFDRHYLLTSRRSGVGHPKSLPSGHAHVKTSSPSAERKEDSRQYILHNNKNNFSENQRASAESSRTSFSSSSCSSSFSSLECGKSIQEPPSLDRIIFPDRFLQNRPKPEVHDPPQFSDQSLRQHPLDLMEVVKDSINKEARSLSVKMSPREQSKNNVSKQRDSPRPVQMSRSTDGSYVIGLNERPKLPGELNESLRVLTKLKEAPWNFSEPGQRPRSSYEGNYLATNETPRFSCDGRESSHLGADSRENVRTASRLRESPRLSLDSRQGSTRSCNLDLKLNSVLNDSKRSESSKNTASSSSGAQQEFSGHKRHSSVVAKLMGLEAMPIFSSVNEKVGDESTNYEKKDNDHQNGQKDVEILSKPSQVGKQNHQTMKSITLAKDPIEIAPWRQQDELRVAKKTVCGHREPRVKKQPESVYSEIEKRLKELEFWQSNKDLRALKQILDSMHEKGILDAKSSDDRPSSSQFRKSYSRQLADDHIRSIKSRKESALNSPPTLASGRAPPRAFESPIVIMKPTKSVVKSATTASAVIPLDHLSGLHKLTGDFVERRKPHISDRMTKDVKSSRKREENCSQRSSSRTIQNSYRPQQSVVRDSRTVRTSNSLSPRLHQRKHEDEKKLHHSAPSSPEPNRSPRQPTKKLSSDSLSPRVKTRRKASHAQQNDEQSCEFSGAHQGDEISIRSDSNISFASQVDTEVTSADRSVELTPVSSNQGKQSPSGRSANNTATTLKHKNSSRTAKEEATESLTAIADQPSPVSVLEASFYNDDLPTSPVTKISALKDVNVAVRLDSTPSAKMRTEINHTKLESIEILVHKLSQLGASDDKTKNTDHIASLCETQDPDHRYVSEILLASGLLMKDLASSPAGPMNIQLHPSGHPINPDLFLVLEQTKSVLLSKVEPVYEGILRQKYDPEKLQRKLVFDLVNEVLIQKLELATAHSLPNLHLQPWRPSRSFPSSQHLLRELCSEIDQLQEERFKVASLLEDNSMPNPDSLCKSEGWEDFKGDISGVVLEIERSIFKGLIDDIVSGEATATSRTKPRRRLFVS